MSKKIILGSDHAGFELKEAVKKSLLESGFEVDDVGANAPNPEDDYPEFILKAAKKVAEDPDNRGIVFGGSGQGEAIVANKVKGIRAALYYGRNSDIVKLSRTHNNANILSLGARFIEEKEAIEAVKLWLDTSFSKEERHRRRVKQIAQIEEKTCK
jgi:ribose 5-phosphate isomerase B